MTGSTLPTPCYVVDEKKLRQNLEILREIEEKSGAHILLAQKAFSGFALYPLIGQYLSGTTASGLYEARLGAEEMGKENHVFAPAYKAEDFSQLLTLCDHLVFNSWSQFLVHRERLQRARAEGNPISIGLRINPEHSTQEHGIYDPCGEFSRLGMTKAALEEGLCRMSLPLGEEGYALPPEVEGLHFHTLCEQGFDDLLSTYRAVEERFHPYLKQVKWLNLGGGHHITREGYDREGLIALVKEIREKYGVTVYLEPGEAVVLDAGELITQVCDIVHNGMDILILDASAACHMPDVIEMPYRPPLKGGGKPGELPYTYRLSSMTCLAGDVIGDYSFMAPISVGDRLVFEDMALYTMVKNNTFNGMPLPSIWLRREEEDDQLIKEFTYADFKSRLS